MQANKWVRWIGASVWVSAAVMFISGCDSGGSSDSGSSAKISSVVGRWELVTEEGGHGFWEFNADGTFSEFDNSDFTAEHLFGTFTQDGNSVTGTLENPGVGDGEIDCTVSDDGLSMEMDFIEHWHDPYKHVAVAGNKL